MKKITLFLMLVVANIPSLVAGANKSDFVLPDNFSAHFTQVFKSVISGKVKKSFGSIEYKYSGMIRFEVEKPDQTLFISNPQKTWYYVAPFIEGESGEVTIRSTGKTELSKFFDSLKNGLTANKVYQVEHMPSKHKYRLLFKQKIARGLGVKEARLGFKKGSKASFLNLQSVELTFTDKNKPKVMLYLSKINSTVKLRPSRFSFQIPANTKINAY